MLVLFLFCALLSQLPQQTAQMRTPMAMAEDYYKFDVSQIADDHLLINCMHLAVHHIKNGTCLNLELLDAHHNASYHIVRSEIPSVCGWNKEDKTIHLSSDCVAQEPNVCLELLGRALIPFGDKYAANEVVPRINQQFNCNGQGQCHAVCENGGHLLAADCSCQCPGGKHMFRDAHCSQLANQRIYTDSSCGQQPVDVSGGELRLSKPMGDGNRTFCEWLLTAADPWARIQIKFSELDLSDRDMSEEGGGCSDKLFVFGLPEGDKKAAISRYCDKDGTRPGQSFTSAGNVLLIKLIGNQQDPRIRDGPVIEYSLKKAPHSDDIKSSGTGHSSGGGDVHIGEGSADGNSASRGLGGLLGGHGFLFALFVVLVAVGLIALVLLGVRRHSANQQKHNPSPVPTSPTPTATA